MAKKAIIIGAGPAGLTAAYELLKRTDIQPIILEKSGDIGGISKTINYKGNRMDIGGHRFFSKSDRVMNWWMNIMPLQQTTEETIISYQNKSRKISDNGATSDPEKVMLLRKRLSRIYFLRKFFTYPIQLSIDTLRKLGVARTFHILLSYIYAQLRPRKPEKSLEDFLINRFGRQLYGLFFKDYTEKVWGVPCNEISAEWGAQRIKGVSISKAIQHAAQQMMKKKKRVSSGDISQKDTETSLIEQFLYPALGPGQLWEEVARQVVEMGGVIEHFQHVKEINFTKGRVTSIVAGNTLTDEEMEYKGDYFFSTMPIKDLIAGMNGGVPGDVREIAAGLQYRDFITVGVLLDRMRAIDPKTGEVRELSLADTWIYIQERDVKVGRLQLFNNWSPYMVNKSGTVWVGMEYFCNEKDEFWSLSDEEIKRTAVAELEKMGLAQVGDVLDSTVHRVEKTYPAYFGTYNEFDKIREYVDEFENLFLVGRNGMHKYNNADHSMLTAMTAVDNIAAGVVSKDNVWAINTEQEYHEKKINLPATIEKMSREGANIRRQEDASDTFYTYIFKSRRNQILITSLFSILIIEFILFKILFPFANFMPDSYAYIDGAYNNNDINTWPIGYSKFLRLLSVFTYSDTAMALLQYLFICFTFTLFILTVSYLLRFKFWILITLSFFLALNPIFLLTSNYVSADILFTSLSLLWLSQLIWIIFKPNLKHVWLQALFLSLAFTVRYNSLYYPVISILVIFISNIRTLYKIIGVVASFLLVGIFVWHTQNHYQRFSGFRQFTPFGGWQLATNSIIMYSRKLLHDENIPKHLQPLHEIVKHHIDSLRELKVRPDTIPGIYYLWGGPLVKFLESKWKADTVTPYFKKWALVAPLYAEYGSYLIKQHPVDYLKTFVFPNALRFYTPPTEFLSQYNMKRDTVGQLAKVWFNYKSEKIKGFAKELNFTKAMTLGNTAINMSFILLVIGLFVFDKYKELTRSARQLTIVVMSFWIMNFLFSVLASSIVLRYQLFNMIVTITFTLFFLQEILRDSKNHRPISIA